MNDVIQQAQSWFDIDNPAALFDAWRDRLPLDDLDPVVAEVVERARCRIFDVALTALGQRANGRAVNLLRIYLEGRQYEQ